MREEESAAVGIGGGEEEQITPSGIIGLKKLTTEHALLIADALATTIMLAHDERSVSAVFDQIEPLARELASARENGQQFRRVLLKHVGNALLVQQRVSSLVAVDEKPDILWERNRTWSRYYAKLEDWYELLKERADVLTRKLRVISESADASPTSSTPSARCAWSEYRIVALIAVEIAFTVFQLWRRLKSLAELRASLRRGTAGGDMNLRGDLRRQLLLLFQQREALRAFGLRLGGALLGLRRRLLGLPFDRIAVAQVYALEQSGLAEEMVASATFLLEAARVAVRRYSVESCNSGCCLRRHRCGLRAHRSRLRAPGPMPFRAAACAGPAAGRRM